jgi:hypothetical protein
MVLRCLAVLRRGDLGAVNRQWAGWSLSSKGGELYSPEGIGFTPGHVRAGPLHAETAKELRRQLNAAIHTVDATQERRNRIEALAALHNAQAAAQAATKAAIDVLMSDLTEPEQTRLHEALDTTKKQRARHREYESVMSDLAASAKA